jgi:integrase
MSTVKLDRAYVASLPAIEGQWWDSEVRGFIVQQRDSDGSMLQSFAFRYRFGGKDRKIKIADVSELSVDQARKIAAKYRVQFLSGIDPQAERKAARVEAAKPTVGSAIEQYLAMKAAEVRPATLRTMKLYLCGAGYFAGLHRRAIDSVTGPDIQSRLDRISTEISAQSAKQAYANLNTFFAWAMCRPFGCKENPVLRTKPPKVEEEQARALSADELRQVWLACDTSDYGKIVKLLILLGCRREEIGGLRWSEIDVDKAILTIPGARTKNGEDLILPLPAPAMEIINSIPRQVGRDFLFGAAGFKGWDRSKKALLKAISDKAKKTQTDEMAPWRLHDLRHTLSTGMHELGIDPHVVEAVINHVSGHKAGVAGRYNHSTYTSQKAQALARWADHIESIVTGQPAKVVAMRAA